MYTLQILHTERAKVPLRLERGGESPVDGVGVERQCVQKSEPSTALEQVDHSRIQATLSFKAAVAW